MPLPDPLDLETHTDGGFAVEIESEDPAPEKAIAAKPGASFFYVVYPNDPGNWHPVTIETGDGDVEPGTYWLPKLQKLPLVPGAEGVRTLRENEAPEKAYEEAFRRHKAAMAADPEVWLGSQLPENPEYQRFRQVAFKILDKALGKVSEGEG